MSGEFRAGDLCLIVDSRGRRYLIDLREGADHHDDWFSVTPIEPGDHILSLTVENYRTERVLLSVFASALPDLCGADAAKDSSNSFRSSLSAKPL